MGTLRICERCQEDGAGEAEEADDGEAAVGKAEVELQVLPDGVPPTGSCSPPCLHPSSRLMSSIHRLLLPLLAAISFFA